MLRQSSTEIVNHCSQDIDNQPIVDIIRLMQTETQVAVNAVSQVQQTIQEFITIVITALKNNGRLFYVGAGTSGRLGVLDAAECPPTFSADPEMVQGIIAGGDAALKCAVEGAEDNGELGRQAILNAGVTAQDIVLGISASGSAPFVAKALLQAKTNGATTWLLTCNNQYPTDSNLDGVILVDTGPEIIAGSTRLKAGTVTKLVLNMISTIAMVKLGKVYGNLMVDVKPTNKKLIQRACRIIANITKCSEEEAKKVLELSGNQTKVAIIMQLKNLERTAAENLLLQHSGFLRGVLK